MDGFGLVCLLGVQPSTATFVKTWQATNHHFLSIHEDIL